jgi:hypothetical protein
MGVVSHAQDVPGVKLPASPTGQAAVQLGGRWEKTTEGGQRYVDGKWIVVDYSRPLLRGRKDIFGAGAEYGTFVYGGAAIWRVGANDTTRLTTQAPLQIGGKTLAPGVYNVFADLKPGNWTLVLNTQPVQEKFDPNDKVRLNGATNYDKAFDVLRVPMTVRPSDASVEQLTLGFVNVTDTTAVFTIAWEKTVASVEVKLTTGTM